MDRRRLEAFQGVAQKAHRILTFVLIALIMLASRIFYLCIYDNDKKLVESRSGRFRYEVISAPRGTIRDRFSYPLAVNGIEYRLSIVWADIVETIPRRIIDHRSPEKKWRFIRKEYIDALSKMISEVIPSLSSKRIQDLIYSYAIYSHSVPITLRSGITESEYCKLAAQASKWPGLHLEIGSKRVYPNQKSLSHIIGYTSAIQREEYEAVFDLRTRLSKAIGYHETGDQDIERDEFLDPLYTLSYEALKKRYAIVERKLYSLKDSAGRSGIEASFESALRGLSGRKSYETNTRGDFLRELPDSKKAIPGKRVCLSVSLELQKKCEELLLQSEFDRSQWLSSEVKRVQEGAMNPFVRGGSIVVLDATNGDILALASAPRYNINDFSSETSSSPAESILGKILQKRRRSKKNSWLQNKEWLSGIWSGTDLLEKEVWNQTTSQIEEEKQSLTWQMLLSLSFPKQSHIHQILSPGKKLYDILEIQKDFFTLQSTLSITSYELAQALIQKNGLDTISSLPVVEAKNRLLKIFSTINTPQEIIACIDMSRLLIRYEESSQSFPFFEKLSRKISLEQFRTLSQTLLKSHALLHDIFYCLYQEGPFQTWRQEHETSFLRQKREIEKEEKKVNQPYITYLDKECESQFKRWWKDNSKRILLSFSLILTQKKNIDLHPSWEINILKHLKEYILRHIHTSSEKNEFSKIFLFAQFFSKFSLEQQYALLSLATPFSQLSEYPLQGSYSPIRRFGRPKSLQDLLSVIASMSSPPIQSLGYMLTTPPGSVFKLITASTLLRNEEKKRDNEPLSSRFFLFEDRFFRIGEKPYVGVSSKGEAIPQIYKGGRIPKSLASSIGFLDLIRAIEYSSNPYFSIAAAECLPTPLLLEEEAKKFGFGEKTGILLPGEAKGLVPTDILTNKTALYTTSIGQHTLLSTPLQIATMLGVYASQGTRFTPKIVSRVIGFTPKADKEIESSYKKMLENIGISFPIWISAQKEVACPRIWVMPNEVRDPVELSSSHRNIIFQGMQKVVQRISKNSLSLKKMKRDRPELYEAFQKQKECMLAKTSTAESYERLGIPHGNSPFMYSHTGIGALFTKSPITLHNSSTEIHPDIVVVVSLQYGSYGKEAGPIAAKVVDEWRKISHKRDHRI